MAIQSDEVAAIVTQKILDDVPDGLANATPFWNYLIGNDTKKKVEGGTFIQFALKLIANQAQGFINGVNAVVPTSPSIQLQFGTLNWKFYNFNANFTLDDYTRQGGRTSIVNFIMEKTEGAMEDAYRDLSIAAYGSSLFNPLAFEGLADITAASGIDYAGLNDTNYQSDAYLPFLSTDTTLNYQTIARMMAQLRGRRQQQKGLTSNEYWGFLNPAGYETMQTEVQNQQRFYTQQADTAKMGWGGFLVNDVKFYLDSDVPGTQDDIAADNHMYILPKGAIKFFYKYGLGSKSPFDGPTRLPQQPIESIQTYIAGNMVATNRRLIAVNKSLIV